MFMIITFLTTNLNFLVKFQKPSNVKSSPVNFTPSLIDAVLKAHNEWLSRSAEAVAKGKKLSQSTGMIRTLNWDEEMRELAEEAIHNSTCDRCQNKGQIFCIDSGRGQNVAAFVRFNDSLESAIVSAVNAWGGQNARARLNNVNARATRIGCAAVVHKDGSVDNLYLTCNYF